MMTRKEQKRRLLTEIDGAIARAKSIKAIDGGGDDGGGALDTIIFEVPGGVKYTIPHNRETLEKFKARVNAVFPTTTKASPQALKSLPAGRSAGRISSEGVSYYNEFKPRKATWIRRAGGDVIGVTRDGFITDTAMAILPGPGKKALAVNMDRDVHTLVSGNAPEIIHAAEFKSPYSKEPLAYLVNAAGDDIFADPKLLDVVLSEHPGAKMFAEGDGHPIAFRDTAGKLVGVVMPMLVDAEADVDAVWVKQNQRSFDAC
jgi:hypothetical protein